MQKTVRQENSCFYWKTFPPVQNCLANFDRIGLWRTIFTTLSTCKSYL